MDMAHPVVPFDRLAIVCCVCCVCCMCCVGCVSGWTLDGCDSTLQEFIVFSGNGTHVACTNCRGRKLGL